MDNKTLNTLEYPKVLARLAGYAAFSASAELASNLHPTSDLEEAQRRQACTSEACRLLDLNAEVGIGGARDIRPAVDLASRGGVLEAAELLEVKTTLIVGRDLSRTLGRIDLPLPILLGIAAALPPPGGIIDAISRAVSDKAEILDEASDKLAMIRREIKTAHQRLIAYLERLINNPRLQPMLQESIITQRGGRYVIPLRADFKGRIRSVIHDQSSSGATLFVEPLPAVELNNRWHELQLAERDEERRILTELSGRVGGCASQIRALVEALAQIDFALMRARYAGDLRAVEPLLVPVVTTREEHPGTTIRLIQARHPLLDPTKVVPIDVELDDQTFAVVITGPNTGGKTVSLKTVGLLALMAQSGLHIPTLSGSVLSVFSEVFADIGDEQSIEQSLSTFSGHVTNIIRVIKRVNSSSLVLFDELGSGTDPQEGAALARAILEYLLAQRVTCLVATHYAELKAFAHNAKGAINASMEFDVRTLRPTYHLTIGLPGRSNALLIARRLGLPEEILALAKRGVSSRDRKVDNLLDEIRRQRELATRNRTEAEQAHREALQQRKELETRLEKIEDERLAILEQARDQAEAELESVRVELSSMRKALGRGYPPMESAQTIEQLSSIKPLQEQVEELLEEVQKPIRKRRLAHPVPRRPLQVGDKVQVRSLKMDGQVIALGENEVEVQLGALRMRARLEDIQRSRAEETPVASPATRSLEPLLPLGILHPSPGIELDLRGQRAEDALAALSNHLEAAYLAGLPHVRIVHGKGTGRLRQAVRDALRQATQVASFETGLDNEGGEGVTVVKLKAE